MQILMVSYQCKNFQKNPCIHFSEHAWTKSFSQTGDRRTDNQEKNRKGETNITPTSFPGSIIIISIEVATVQHFNQYLCNRQQHYLQSTKVQNSSSKKTLIMPLQYWKLKIVFVIWLLSLHNFTVKLWNKFLNEIYSILFCFITFG